MLKSIKRRGSYYAHTDPDDVARVEDCTFICSTNEDAAGPTNNWKDPKEMKERLHSLFDGCMEGRTMYIIPYCMGVVGSQLAKYGIEITDSPYVVVNMRIMTRIGKEVLDQIEKTGDFVPGVHSVGMPLLDGQEDSLWPCNKEKVIAHFPETKEIWTYGSGYGGNALLGKKCFALRIASTIAREEGWMAEHMLIMGIKNPDGKKKYFAAAFPSACGKTNLAMMKSALPGWEVTCVGDDIAWMRFDKNGQLRAMNPEHGFFGVAPGTSETSNPNAIRLIKENTIFTNVALTDDNEVWWEGLTKDPPEHLTDWKGESWKRGSDTPASHPNARFTAPIEQCPVLDEKAFDPEGVPIDGIIYGGRRSTLLPLVIQARSWAHGVFLGAGLTSEMTAAAKGEIGKVRHDPFAMLPFCGYHMGDYFSHWLNLEIPGRKMPSIFRVNWFRSDAEGDLLWPGYGDNIRVIKWMCDRIDGVADAKDEAIGYIPKSIDLTGLKLKDSAMNDLLFIDKEGFLEDLEDEREYFSMFGNHFPKELISQLEEKEARLR